jgi:uncharacterized protein YhhL (DUF1145 family)
VIVLYLVHWIIGLLNLPHPVNRIVLVIVALIALLVLLDLLGLYSFRGR